MASNHLSFLDPPALAVANSRKLHFMARDDLFTLPILGRVISSVNAFPVKREKVDVKAIKEALKRLTDGKVVALFPEGRRIFDGALGPAELGVGLLAWRSKAKVIPVYIKGSNLALPRNAKFIRLKKISVYFGKPLTPDEIADSAGKKKEVYQKIADAVMDRIDQLKESSKS